MQIIVLGMHRSGTSLTTRLINMMGAYLGPEGSTIIGKDNPKGHWERRDVVRLNDMLLTLKGCSWQDLMRWGGDSAYPDNILIEIRKIILGMDGFRPWVLKDPRLCIVMPAWRPYLEVPIAVIVHRDPAEIATSLHKRDGLPMSTGIALWERYANGIATQSKDMPKLFVSHRELLQRPVETCERLYQQLTALGVRRLAVPSEREITAFVDPRLYRSKPGNDAPALTPNQQMLVEMMSGKRTFP